MTYNWQFYIVWKYKEALLKATLVTLELTILVCILGTILGFTIALLQQTKNRWLTIPIRIYVDVIRGIPLLILLLWLYYCIPIFTGIKISSFLTALIGLSINVSPFISEIVRSGIESIPKGQYESSKILGFTKTQTMIRIIIPQAIKQMIPNLVSMYITMLKFSSFASIIAVNELLHSANVLISNTYKPLEIYTTIAIMYVIMVIPLTYFAEFLEKRLEKKKSLLGGFYGRLT